MRNNRLALAIERLDRALMRVERASVDVGRGDERQLTLLRQQHERLRERTREAIEALDRLTGAA